MKLIESKKVKIEDLANHPNQKLIYSDKADQKLKMTIMTFGLLEPIKIADGSLYGLSEKYVIISGHRRVDVCQQLAWPEISATIWEYDDKNEADTNFATSNIYREKTEEQKINEFLYLKQILCQMKENANTKVLQGIKERGGDINEASHISHIMEGGEDKRKMISEYLGVSEHTVQVYTAVFDEEYLDKLINKYRALGVLDNEKTAEAHEIYDEFRAKVKNGEFSHTQAYAEVKEFKKDLEDRHKANLQEESRKRILTKKEEAKISKMPQTATAKIDKIKKAKPYQLPVNELFTSESVISVADAPIIATNKSKTTRMYFIGSSVLINGKNGLKRISQLALLDAYNKIG